jgi:hypothetical protein
VPAAAVVPAVDREWLRVVEAAQKQAAEAQAVFQRTMAENHLAYLRMAETALAGMLGAAGARVTGETAEPVAARRELPQPGWTPPVPAPPEPGWMPSVSAQPESAWAAPVGAPAPQAPTPQTWTAPVAETEPVALDEESIGAVLLSVVADRTGFPEEMLNLDMELDTDLGIDSIKKVEILSAVRERVGDVSGGDTSALGALRTLRAIAVMVSGAAPAAVRPDDHGPSPAPASSPPAWASSSPAAVSSSPAAVSSSPAADGCSPAADGSSAASDSGAASAAPVTRWTPRAVARPRSGLAMAGLADGPVVVTDDGTGIASLVAAGLTDHGIPAEVVAGIPDGASRVIVLDGLRDVASIEDALEAGRAVFRAARRAADPAYTKGGIFVAVQDTGGDFGLTPAASLRAWSAGPAALVRTVAKEWPLASVKAIDCQVAAREPAAVAEAIVAELLGGGGTELVGLRADGTRLTLELTETDPSDPVEDPVDGPAREPIGPHSVIVATGGARGVTAAALRLLAEKHHPRLVLFGRTPLAGEPDGLAGAADEGPLVRLLAARGKGTPGELTRQARGILAAREVRDTLDTLGKLAEAVRYLVVDVRDAAAVARALAEVRQDWGPITGIVHGAGVLADGLIAGKTDEAYAEVFDTKVGGLRALLTATAGDPIDLLCAFSSIASVFGNAGQSDYAMANEVVNHVLSAERAARPGCLVRSIAWGPWQGGMVTPERAGRFGRAGVPLIDLDAGARAFLDEVDGSSRDVRVVLAAGGPDALKALAGTEFCAQVTVAGPGHAQLADHAIDGDAVLPVAAVLDWFAGAAVSWGRSNGGGVPVVLRDLRVLDKISLPRLAGERGDGHRLIVRGRPATAGDGLDLELVAEDGRPHYRASAVVGTAPISAGWEIPGEAVPLSDPYDGATLFHGPRFRAIRGKPRVSPAGADAMVAGAPALGWDGASGQVDPAAVDGGLQLAVLWAREAGAGRTLPMAIRECRVYRPGLAGSEVRCLVRAVQVDGAGARCDIALVDPDLSPRVELIGVHLVRRPE